MKATCYLTIQGKPPKYGTPEARRFKREPGTIRVAKTRPNTRSDEIAIKLDVEIPDALYIKPQLEARVTVPDDGSRGPVITAEIADNIAEAIRERTGLEVRISAADEDGEED